MNHKELIQNMADELQMPAKELTQHMAVATELMLEHLTNGEDIAIPGFGTLEVRKKNERLIVHPVSKTRTLVPPKLVLCFKQSTATKEKFKDIKL